MEAAQLMITEAKRGGADAVKFQTYKAEKLASKHSPAYWDQNEEPTDSQYELFKKFDHFDADDYDALARFCEEKKIDFLSTPFDEEAVHFLDGNIKYFKIASADITNIPLLSKIASKGKPILLSTGASTVEEIDFAIEEISRINQGIKIVLLHCVLSYPTKNENANLHRITFLRNRYTEQEIGYSDHTLPDKNMVITSSAYALGATVIEKHFTLDKELKGNDHYHAMDVNDLKKLRENLDVLETAFSKNEKNYLECEENSRKQARRSLVASKYMPKGHIVKYENLAVKRPGTGISPLEMKNVIGKEVKTDINNDEILVWEMLK